MYKDITILLNILQTTDKLFKKIILTTAKAGFPSPSDQFKKQPLDLNSIIIKNRPSTFFMKVEGDSMINAGILDKDIVTVDKSLEAKNGDVIIAEYNGEFLIKQLSIIKNEVYLIPANNNFQTIKIKNNDNFAIWGVVTFVIRRLK